jgi:hypothetical protein
MNMLETIGDHMRLSIRIEAQAVPSRVHEITENGQARRVARLIGGGGRESPRQALMSCQAGRGSNRTEFSFARRFPVERRRPATRRIRSLVVSQAACLRG